MFKVDKKQKRDLRQPRGEASQEEERKTVRSRQMHEGRMLQDDDRNLEKVF